MCWPASQDAKVKPFQCMFKHSHISDMFHSSKIIMFRDRIHVILIFDLFKSGGTQRPTALVFLTTVQHYFVSPYNFFVDTTQLDPVIYATFTSGKHFVVIQP